MIFPHTVTHQRRSVSRGSHGGETEAAETSLGTKTCFVQSVNAFEDPRWQRDDYSVTHVVFFETDPEAQERDEFVFGTMTLEVRSQFDELSLGRVYRVDCEEVKGKSL